MPASLALALLGVAAVLGTSACITEQDLASAPITCPTEENFRAVSSVLERRCGTLDCHGVLARPLRIYGQYGLRRPQAPVEGLPFDYDEYFTGGEVSTTDAEVADNYLAACALEPELMVSVLSGEEPAEALTLVRKPRLEEAHKGGKIWDGTTKGDACLLSWIAGEVQPEPCRLELERP
jgi:hypothetical protein